MTKADRWFALDLDTHGAEHFEIAIKPTHSQAQPADQRGACLWPLADFL